MSAPGFNKYYQKHLKCLKLNGFRPKTIDAYSRAIRRIGNYFDSQVDNLTSDQILDYFTEPLELHSCSTVKFDLYGLRFFYSHVLNKPWEEQSNLIRSLTSYGHLSYVEF